jgi:hypothetical protein
VVAGLAASRVTGCALTGHPVATARPSPGARARRCGAAAAAAVARTTKPSFCRAAARLPPREQGARTYPQRSGSATTTTRCTRARAHTAARCAERAARRGA